LKPAMNEKEEKDYDALNVEIYLNNYWKIYLHGSILTLEWIFDPIPIENISDYSTFNKLEFICCFKTQTS
jgi:hypothetical protein